MILFIIQLLNKITKTQVFQNCDWYEFSCASHSDDIYDNWKATIRMKNTEAKCPQMTGSSHVSAILFQSIPVVAACLVILRCTLVKASTPLNECSGGIQQHTHPGFIAGGVYRQKHEQKKRHWFNDRWVLPLAPYRGHACTHLVILPDSHLCLYRSQVRTGCAS